MAKIDFSQPITGLGGQILYVTEPKEGEEAEKLTLGSFVALLLNTSQDRQTTQIARGKLAMQIYDGGEIEVSVEDLSMMRKVLESSHQAVPAAQAHAMLDV